MSEKIIKKIEIAGWCFLLFLIGGLVCNFGWKIYQYHQSRKVKNYDIDFKFKPQVCTNADGEVNIALVTDKNYVDFVRVAINSAIHTKCPNSKYNFYILTLGIEDSSVFESLSTENVKVKVIPQKDIQLPFRQFTYISKAVLLKYYVAQALPNVDKVLFVDADVLILKDLSSVFNTNIEDYYLAAVKDAEEKCDVNFMKRLNVKNRNFYFNSGVMLLNSAKIRDEGMLEKLEDYTRHRQGMLLDQDAFNMASGDKVLELDFIYNAQMWIFNYGYDYKMLKKYHWKSYEDAFGDITIMHFSRNLKPNNIFISKNKCFYMLHKLWYKYYNDLPELTISLPQNNEIVNASL